MSDDYPLRIRYGEPQHAWLTRHLFQQCLLLRVMHPHSHTYSRAGLQSANEYISLFPAASAWRQRSHGHSRE